MQFLCQKLVHELSPLELPRLVSDLGGFLPDHVVFWISINQLVHRSLHLSGCIFVQRTNSGPSLTFQDLRTRQQLSVCRGYTSRSSFAAQVDVPDPYSG